MPKRRLTPRPGPISKGFAARLRAAREAQGLTKEKLADRSGLTRQRIIHFEQGVQHPRVSEVEILANALKTDAASLLGLAALPAQPDSAPSREILEGVARHLREAADAITKLLAPPPVELEVEKLLVPQATPSSSRWPWEEILPVANRILQEKPKKTWRPIELAQAIKATGLKLQTYRGLHFAMMPHLRNTNLIVEKADGTFTSRLLKSPPPEPVPATTGKSEKAKAPQGSLPASRRRATVRNPALLNVAPAILNANPARVWKPIEFVHALRTARFHLPTWRGVHFYLPKMLQDAGLVEIKADGRFIASRKPEQTLAKSESPRDRRPIAQEPSVIRDSPPAARPDDQASSVTSLAKEVEALAPRLTGMTPRERVAQLAVWAGRARQLDEILDRKQLPMNSGLRNQVKHTLVRLKKLRKSLGCGWVDALSIGWSTNWDIYIEFNRGVAASETSNLSSEQERIYFHDLLKSILGVRRSYAQDLDAPALVIEASQVLDERDPLLVEARRRFGHHEDRRISDARPAAPFRRQADAPQRVETENKSASGVPRSVLKITRGRTLLIAGGRGSHDAQRLAVKRGLQFKAVDWITGERHPNPADLFSMAIRNKKYDIVLLMPGTNDSEPMVLACKAAGAKLMYLTRGPSIPSVAEAISAELLVGEQALGLGAR